MHREIPIIVFYGFVVNRLTLTSLLFMPC